MEISLPIAQRPPSRRGTVGASPKDCSSSGFELLSDPPLGTFHTRPRAGLPWNQIGGVDSQLGECVDPAGSLVYLSLKPFESFLDLPKA